MTQTETQLLQRIESLEAKVAVLSSRQPKTVSERITPAEIAAKFGVCQRTVRNMKNDFEFLYPIHKRTAKNRIYWLRKDYENALKRRDAKKKGLVRR